MRLGLPHLHFLMLACSLLLRHLLLKVTDLLYQFLSFKLYFLNHFILIRLNCLVHRMSNFLLAIGLQKKKKVRFLFSYPLSMKFLAFPLLLSFGLSFHVLLFLPTSVLRPLFFRFPLIVVFNVLLLPFFAFLPMLSLAAFR